MSRAPEHDAVDALRRATNEVAAALALAKGANLPDTEQLLELLADQCATAMGFLKMEIAAVEAQRYTRGQEAPR